MSNSNFETFVLLEEMNPHNMNLFRRIGKDRRERIDKRKDYSPFLRTTISKDGTRVVLRYKENTDLIEQDEQIKKGILANAPFTAGEYSAMQFVYGTKTTNDPVIKRYLKEYAGFEGNNHTSTDSPRKEYKLLDFAKEAKDLNAFTRERVKAVNRILSMELEETKETLWRVFGTYYTPAEDIEENQNKLVKYLDENDDAVSEILKDDITPDDEATILIGKAVSAGKLSFNASNGQVSRKKGDAWIDVKAISSELESGERIRLFSQFITSDAGKLLKEDIENDLGSTLTTKSRDKGETSMAIDTNVTLAKTITNVPVTVKREYNKKKTKKKSPKPKKYSAEKTQETVDINVEN